MADKTIIDGKEGLKALVGKEIGQSAPMCIDQEAINRFAEATGDKQWIHVDPEKAARGPFQGTIVHGYFLLSLIPKLLTDEMIELKNFMGALNYGLNKVRFPEVVKSGSKVVLSARLASAEPKPMGLLGTFELTLQVEGAKKPCMVAECLYLFV